MNLFCWRIVRHIKKKKLNQSGHCGLLFEHILELNQHNHISNHELHIWIGALCICSIRPELRDVALHTAKDRSETRIFLPANFNTKNLQFTFRNAINIYAPPSLVRGHKHETCTQACDSVESHHIIHTAVDDGHKSIIFIVNAPGYWWPLYVRFSLVSVCSVLMHLAVGFSFVSATSPTHRRVACNLWMCVCCASFDET